MKVAFTFDDGLKDHILYAAPTLEKYGYRGIFCITTSYVGQNGYMTWEEVNDLVRRGHEIAAHSVDHKNLYELCREKRFEEIQHQIDDSRKQIEARINRAVKYFAFPHNAHNGFLFKMVRRLGMEPLSPSRINLGGPPANPVRELGAYLDQQARRREKYAILMFHGLVDRNAYACYSEDCMSFDVRVKDVKHHEGRYFSVIKYAEAKWPLHDAHSLLFRICNRIRKLWINTICSSV